METTPFVYLMMQIMFFHCGICHLITMLVSVCVWFLNFNQKVNFYDMSVSSFKDFCLCHFSCQHETFSSHLTSSSPACCNSCCSHLEGLPFHCPVVERLYPLYRVYLTLLFLHEAAMILYNQTLFFSTKFIMSCLHYVHVLLALLIAFFLTVMFL